MTCAFTRSAVKKVLPLGCQSRGNDELNLRGGGGKIDKHTAAHQLLKSLVIDPDMNGMHIHSN